jgi:hypothetical protein
MDHLRKRLNPGNREMPTDPATERGMRASARKTGPATALRPSGKAIGRAGGAACPALLVLLSLCLCLIGAPSSAQEKDTVLPGSGIHYPGGYDPNTAGEIRGRVERVKKEQGPVQLQVRSGREVYTVLAGPPWYWDKIKASVPENTDIRVRGSKALGADGRLYIIAQEIIPAAGKPIVFRDEDGYPAWSAADSGRKAGFGSPLGTGSGPARGGGMGHGRR